MADNFSNGSENEEVADQFSVWVMRSQGTQTHPIVQTLMLKDKRIWHPNRTTMLTLTMRPSPQEILFALGNICHSETPGKESFSCVAKFYKIDSEILEAKQKMYASFCRVCGLGYMTADWNAREWSIWNVARVF